MNWKMIAAGAVIAIVAAVAVGYVMMSSPSDTTTPTEARVRVAHLSPDAPAVDVWVDGTMAFSTVSFKEITAYATLPAGPHEVKVVPAGQTSPAVIAATLTLAADTHYTVMAVGELASIEPVVKTDSPESHPGEAHVRFVHASPDAPAVDIAVKGGQVLFSNVEFKETAAFVDVPAGTYDLEVRLAGTSTVVLDLPSIALEGAKSYTAYAVGLASDGSLAAILNLEN